MSPEVRKPRTQRGAVKSPVTNWGDHDDVYQGKFQETSGIERQAVISAQLLAAALRSEMSQGRTACDSWIKAK